MLFRCGVYVAAPNDVNGNARRGWIVLGADTTREPYMMALGFLDEGSYGTTYWRHVHPQWPSTDPGNPIHITPAEYLELSGKRKRSAGSQRKRG